MNPENDDARESAEPAPAPKPVKAEPVKAAPVHPVVALPRYSHALLGQSLVGSRMVEDPDGEWVRRADVLKLL